MTVIKCYRNKYYMNTKGVIPFDKMPKNINELLTKNDYTYALLHPGGFKQGIFEVIHLNENYPQWHNIVRNPMKPDDMLIYTKKGWVERDFEEIFKIFNYEYVSCFSYAYEHRDQFYGITKDLTKDI